MEIFGKIYCGRIKFINNDKYGYVDENLNVIIPAIYDNVYNFQENHNCAIVSLKNKFGIIDTFGKILLPIEYDYITNFNDLSYDDFATVKKNKKFGIINKNFNFVIKCNYINPSIAEQQLKSLFIAIERNEKLLKLF